MAIESNNGLRLVLFFVVLTVLLTLVVVYTWEYLLMSPLYDYVELYYPGAENADYRWKLAQRIEHFFISIIVDTIVVTLLLRIVNKQQCSLRASEERYRAIFEHAHDGIGIVTAADHRLVEFNKRFAEILRTPSPSLLNTHACKLFIPEKVEDLSNSNVNCIPTHGLEFVVTSGEGGREALVRTPTGPPVPVSVSCSRMETGKERLFILILRDLTEHKLLESEREEVQARLAQNERISALGRMAAQVAHEVKNPLAGLRLYSLHLKSKTSQVLDEASSSLVDKIINGINHLSSTVDQVLNFARPITLTRRSVNLNRLVSEAVQLLEPQLSAKQIRVEMGLAEPGALASLDEPSMRSTLINLMLNSIQAMPERGKLSVSTCHMNGKIELRIEDTGIGITDEQLKNVFEPFYTTKSQGLGLGMSYAWKIIEQHGGSVAVDSRAGVGTAIKITLPGEE